MKDKRGILFYADNKGKLKEICCDHSILKKAPTQIKTMINRHTQNFKDFFKNLTSNIAKNIFYCGKTFVNFGKTFFAKDALKTLI